MPTATGSISASPATLDLLSAVAAGEYAVAYDSAAGVSLPSTPRLGHETADYERRPAVLLSDGDWSWTGMVPRGGQLVVGATPVLQSTDTSSPSGGAGQTSDTVELSLVVEHRGVREVVAVGRTDAALPGWVDLVVDLGRWSRRQVKVVVTAKSSTGQVAFGPARISAGVRREGPPNVLVILVDTLRWDHMSVYGYERPTTPGIERTLAQRGVVLEQAYSQAPWTLPSMVSLFTGRYPGEVLGPSMPDYELPDNLPSLPERFRDLGYETAAFYANPALFRRAGFDRGLDTVFIPPTDLSWWIDRHAEDVNRRALPWIAAHRDRPFFLWAHYLDPHDPYLNPDLVDGRSPYYPDYQGHLTGKMVHGVYAQVHPLESPEDDVAHLTALYDSEVTYVDRWVARLLDSLEPELLENTLVIFTSDHGEELYDHGGWKHGYTLYEEQIHVPLIFRWDGVLPAGERLRGTAQLLDLAPTLAAAVGAPVDPQWQGLNLLPALRGDESLPRRPAFAQHLSIGPLRAAAMLEDDKLIFFNHATPYEPPDRLHARLWTQDLARMAPVEVYDLEEDPAERRNLAARPSGRATTETLAPVIHRRLEPRLQGLRVAPHQVPPGSRLTVRLKFEAPPAGWLPYFLADGDTVSLEGNTLRATFVGLDELMAPAAPGRGVRVVGDFRALADAEVLLDGEVLEPSAALQVVDRPWNGEAIPAPRLRAATYPSPPAQGGPGIRIWLPPLPRSGEGPPEPSAEDAEAREERRRGLQAIGYLGGGGL